MNVLFVHYGMDWIAGSEVALLALLKRMPANGVTPFLWCNSPTMADAARAIGVKVHCELFDFYFDYSSPRFDFSAYLRQVCQGRRLIRDLKIDLVHCNSAAPAQWMLPAGWLTRRPVLSHIHGPYLKRSRFVLGLPLADAVVSVSQVLADQFVADGIAPERVKMITNGFDFAALECGDRKSLRSELGVPAGAVVGAIIGSIIPRKGHDIALAALRQRPGGGPSFHLLIVGDGPDREALEATARGLPVHFLGHCTDVGAILRDAVDLLLVPSRSEAFGRVIIEAAHFGVPAIGTAVDGIPEAIVDGKTGLLVPSSDPSAWVTAITRLVKDESLRRKLGQAGQKRADEAFDISDRAAEMVGVYKSLLKERKAALLNMPLRPLRYRPYFKLILPG